MIASRFLPDLAFQLATLAGCLWILRKWPVSKTLRVAFGVLAALIPAALVVILLEALDLEAAFRALWIPGLSMAGCVAFWAGLVLRAIVLGGGTGIRRLTSTPSPAPSTAPPSAGERPDRRDILRMAADATLVLPATALGAGIISGRRNFRMVEVDLPIPDLHPDLEGLRLVQLSDIHLSPFLSRRDLAYCVDLANEARAHVAFVTGDLITGIRDSIDNCLDELKRLQADAGVFGCTGNHEMYIDAEGYTAEAASSRGMRFLHRERTILRFGGAAINLAGVEHQHQESRGYLVGAGSLLARANGEPADLNLLLSHNPAVFETAAALGWDLTLAGHLHGGQLNLELASVGIELNPARIRSPYVYGRYRIGAHSIYVTRGIGTIGMPVRLGAPPEVAFIRLRREVKPPSPLPSPRAPA